MESIHSLALGIAGGIVVVGLLYLIAGILTVNNREDTDDDEM